MSNAHSAHAVHAPVHNRAAAKPSHAAHPETSHGEPAHPHVEPQPSSNRETQSKAGLKSHTKNKHRSEQAAASLFGHWSEQTPKGKSLQQDRTAKPQADLARLGRDASFDENLGLVDDAQEPEAGDAEDQESQENGLVSTGSETSDQKPNSATKPTATTTSGGRKNPHSKRYEHKVKKKSAYFAKTDKYNKARVKSNKIHKNKKTHKAAKNQYNRPGVRYGDKNTGSDTYTIKDSVAYRYTFTKENGINKAVQIDSIKKEKISKTKVHKGEGKNALTINPAQIKKLLIDKKEHDCVLSYMIPSGLPAWIKISDLDVDIKKFRKSLKQATKKWNPENAMEEAKKHDKKLKFDEYQFVTDEVSENDEKKDGDLRYIMQHQTKQKNQAMDYLLHNKRKDETTGKLIEVSNDADPCDGVIRKEPAKLRQERFQYIGINQSLPQADAPPVFIDYVLPGAHFFVPKEKGKGKGKEFYREIGLYGRKQDTTNVRQTWVYGFVGQKAGPDEGSANSPDPSRFGWVPLRVIKKVKKAKKPKK